MLKTINVFSVLCLLSISLFAQEKRFYMPREISDAYEKGTRSYDGKPGPNYWQNSVDYDISVEVVPSTRALLGSETIVFQNNSPDELNVLVIRLYQDVFKEGNERGNAVKPTDINEGMIISRVAVDGVELDPDESFQKRGTNMYVTLPEPVSAGENATIEISWETIIPETTVRMGAYDSTSFFVSYWYPQVAVYDDIFGWDNLSYDFDAEFYNNLGDFDVEITAPKHFTVMATGELSNAKEVLQKDQFKRYKKAHNSEETITIISTEDLANNYKNKKGTWNYFAEDVTDFSFCLSDHFVWDGAVQQVENRNVFISSFYNFTVAPQSTELTQIQRKTMKHFSEDVPGIAYPYPEFTTCVMGVGGGGMETPMMANNGRPGRGVTIHEMFHTYFPMYVRINEKRFAWMDEGWADFNTSYVADRYFENDTSLLITDYGNSVNSTLGSISDLPLITSTQFMDNSNYGYASYTLPAFVYSILHHHLGDELFRQAYKEYISDWAKKSPTPYDFFYTFERVSGEDLSWLWKPWFFTYGDVDIKIERLEDDILTIGNNASRPVPVVIEVTYNDDSQWMQDFSAAKWNGESTIRVSIPGSNDIKAVSVNGSIPDANILDNYKPGLAERYGDVKVDEAVFGKYSINEFAVTATVSSKKGIVHLSIFGFESYFLPDGEGGFQSLDGNFTFKVKDNQIVLQLKSFGVTLTGSKK